MTSDPFTADELYDIFEAARKKRSSSNGNHSDGPWESPTPLVDWLEAYGNGDDPAQWLAEPLLPDLAAVAIFAKGGTGKSLLALWLAAGLATGQGLTGPCEPIHVLYLDYEMTMRDVVSRLEDMGYTDPAALERLHYASLPTLPALDTPAGGRAVVDMAQHLGAQLVIVDTFGRAVDGEEDRADTVRAWYRCTGQPLKAAGIPYTRIDHAGKDAKRGQRGTSAKNDDVDIVWEMTETGKGEYTLKATKRRIHTVPERVVLTQTEDNYILAYRWDAERKGYRAGTKQVADLLDQLGAPVDISRRKAIDLLRRAGEGRDNNVVGDAVRYRRDPQYHSQYHPNPTGSGGAQYRDAETANPLQIPHQYHPIPPDEGKGVEEDTPVGGASIPPHPFNPDDPF